MRDQVDGKGRPGSEGGACGAPGGSGDLIAAVDVVGVEQALRGQPAHMLISRAVGDEGAFTAALDRAGQAELGQVLAAARACGFRLTPAAPISREGARDPLLAWQQAQVDI